MVDTQEPNLINGTDPVPVTEPTTQVASSPPPTPPSLEPESQKPPTSKVLLLGGLISAILILTALVFLATQNKISLPGINPPSTTTGKIEKFISDEEFRQYLEEGESLSTGYFGSISRGIGVQESIALDSDANFGATLTAPTSEAGRVSETNVQVKGIDEPDIVKTNGKEIFVSINSPYYYRGVPEPFLLEDVSVDAILPPQPAATNTKVVSAFPPADLSKVSDIDKSGNLLLSDNNLIIFENNTIYGYDVTEKSSPSQKWSFELQSNNQIESSRFYDGKVYVVSKTRASSSMPCPMIISTSPSSLTIPCTDIYHPEANIPVDSVYTVMTFDPASGEVSDTTSFVGSSGSSVVYMSPNATYITYPVPGDVAEFFFQFFSTKGVDLISPEVLSKLDNLRSLDISSAAQMVELETIIESYFNSLTDDERLRIENEMANRMQEFSKSKAREFEKTGIVKVDNNKLTVEANGEVPGSPLNQFSLDEYEGNLRIATTLGRSMFNSSDSANDVYVLDNNLNVEGQVLDLGLTERIYSVRFIEDKGYVVTFRQIDPFYVIDLSNPSSPEVKGELKIPGFSSYLHPINKDKILGVGEENGQVKLSLFDVSSPSNPTEVSKYQLDEYWSGVEESHHAFLLDPDNQIFFLPGSQGGYIFSYKGDELKLERAVSDIRAKRAVYLDNYLYVIGEDKIIVLNESDWQEVNSLEL